MVECWTCGEDHATADCPNRFYAPRQPTPGKRENLLVGESSFGFNTPALLQHGIRLKDDNRTSADTSMNGSTSSSTTGSSNESITSSNGGQVPEVEGGLSLPAHYLIGRRLSWADDAARARGGGSSGSGSGSGTSSPLRQTESPKHPFDSMAVRQDPQVKRPGIKAPIRRSRSCSDIELTPGRMSLLTVRYIVAQLGTLSQVRLGVTFFLGGLVCDAPQINHILPVVLVGVGSFLFINISFFTTSKVAKAARAHLLEDKSRIKLIIVILQLAPILMEIYGHFVLFSSIQQYPILSAIAFVWVMGWLTLSYSAIPVKSDLLRFQVTKFALKAIVLLFFLGGQNYEICRHLVGPMLIASGGTCFLTVPPEVVESSVRTSIALMLHDVFSSMNKKKLNEDQVMRVAVTRWLLEYWSQPPDFIWEDWMPMLEHMLEIMRKELGDETGQTITKVQNRLRNFNTDKAAVRYTDGKSPSQDRKRLIVEGARQGVNSIPPSRRFSVFILYCRCTRHITIFFLLLLFVGPAFALVPLLLLDLVAVALATPSVLALYRKPRNDAGAMLLVLGRTGLAAVWQNLLYSVTALETGLEVSCSHRRSIKAEGFKDTVFVQQGSRSPKRTLSSEGWVFAAGWARKELIRVHSCPEQDMTRAASDGVLMYQSVMALYGEWLVHAPGFFNQWLHSAAFTKKQLGHFRERQRSSSIQSLSLSALTPSRSQWYPSQAPREGYDGTQYVVLSDEQHSSTTTASTAPTLSEAEALPWYSLSRWFGSQGAIPTTQMAHKETEGLHGMAAEVAYDSLDLSTSRGMLGGESLGGMDSQPLHDTEHMLITKIRNPFLKKEGGEAPSSGDASTASDMDPTDAGLTGYLLKSVLGLSLWSAPPPMDPTKDSTSPPLAVGPPAASEDGDVNPANLTTAT